MNPVSPRQKHRIGPSSLQFSGLLSILLIALCPYAAQARTFQAWKPITPADLAATASVADAPAEALFWTVDVDDTDYPHGRTTKEYVRYKIFDPEKSVRLTRISELEASSDGMELRTVDVLARLTLPDGTSREFNKDAIQERNVQKSGEDNWFSRLVGNTGTEVQEKALAVPGIVAGSILEIQVTRTDNVRGTLYVTVLQKVGVPVRQLEYTQQIPDSYDYIPRPFVINGGVYHATLKADKKKGLLDLTATDLPQLYNEPLSPPVLDRALAVAGSYIQVHAMIRTHKLDTSITSDPNAGPWGGVATRNSMIEKDTTENWGELDHKAKALTAGATTELEKAQRIHAYVHAHFLEFMRSPRSGRSMLMQFYTATPEEVIDYADYPTAPIQRADFLWLAVGLYKAAGLQTQTIMLPDNNVIRFDPQMTSEVFLPDLCARVKVDGSWMFSFPHSPLPFPLGALPPANVGRQGLIVQVNKSEFVDIPPFKAENSVVADVGTFELAADGSVSGHGVRTLTGMPAVTLKGRMRNLPADRRARNMARVLKTELKADKVLVSAVTGSDSADEPLVIHYTIEWTNYATLTKTRLIFVPAVFEGHTEPLFGAAVRHNDVVFPFPVTQTENYTLHLPDGFKLEAPSAPPSIPGKILRLDYAMQYSASTNTITTSRTHVSQLTHVGVQDYPRLKQWFDHETVLDSHEMVLIKQSAAVPPASPAPAMPPPAAPAAAAKVE